jgi:ABC-type sugar transport system substrate-binding protein
MKEVRMRSRSWFVAAAVIGVLAIAAPVAAQSPAASGGAGIQKGVQGTAADLTLSDADKAAAKAKAAGKLVGIVATTMTTEYHANLNNSAKSMLEGLGFTVEICDSNVDTQKALDCFEGFVQKGASAIITTSSAATVGDAAKQAIADGTIVVQVTGLDLGDTGAVGISVNNLTIGTAEGKAAGEYAAAKWPGQPVEVIILDYPDIPDLVARADAIQTAMTAANPNVKVDGRFKGGLRENGVTSTETALQQFPNLKGIVGINDGGDLGGYDAMKAANIAPDAGFVFGIDCDPEAKTIIDQGTLYKGCVDTNPSGTGQLAAAAIAKLVGGGSVPGSVEVPVSVYTGSGASASPAASTAP